MSGDGLPTTSVTPDEPVYMRVALASSEDRLRHLAVAVLSWAREFQDVAAGVSVCEHEDSGAEVVLTIEAGSVRQLARGEGLGPHALRALRELVLRCAHFTPTPLVTPVGVRPALGREGLATLASYVKAAEDDSE